MNGLAVFGTMQSQAFNVCGQAPFHDEHSWRAVGMCSLATTDRTCAQGDMQCERNNPGRQRYVRVAFGITQHHGRIQRCSVLVKKTNRK